MTIGERIRLRREELNMSQEELAIKCGYSSRSTINKIELDQRNLPQPKIMSMATALDVTIPWLLGVDSTAPDPPEQDEIAALLESATDAQKREILRYIKYILQSD